MATSSHARAVKSLNDSGGRRRFVFKKFKQQVEDIDINVFRSLEPIKLEPSAGSTFFRDCLVEWRELNTAEDFISFYEIMLPKVQTLPLVVLHKEFILSELLNRLTMKARLSLEPILRLVAALSRDLLEDFLPFLPRVSDSLLHLLESGAEREPEILEQIFTSWSYIVMYLQKYLVQDIIHILRVTRRLRYGSKAYVQEFMAKAVSFLLRNASMEQLINGIQKVVFEVSRKQSPAREIFFSALLQNTMQGSPARFHSRAGDVFRILISSTTFSIADKCSEGLKTLLQVLGTALISLCEALDPCDASSMWEWLCEAITNNVHDGCLLHTNYLLTLLISVAKVTRGNKRPDNQKMCELVELLMKTYIKPFGTVDVDHASKIIDMTSNLMLCVIDGLHDTYNISALSGIASQWAPFFKLKSKSLLSFVEELLTRDPCILSIFRVDILGVLNDLIENSQKKVISLMVALCEKLQTQSFRSLDGNPEGRISSLISFLHQALILGSQSLGVMHVDHPVPQFTEAEVALLWGVSFCYSYMPDTQENRSLLMNMVDCLDQLSELNCDDFAGCPRHDWPNLAGAILSSYLRMITHEGPSAEDASKYLYLARKHKSSLRVLVAVADFLDLTDKPPLKRSTVRKIFNPELSAEKLIESVDVFSENLSHSNKEIRVSTLRILCHYEPLSCEPGVEAGPIGKEEDINGPDKCLADIHHTDVLALLHLIETTPLDVSSSRKATLLVSKLQTLLASSKMSEAYVAFVLYGSIGLFYNNLSYLWAPAVECLSVLLSKYAETAWDKFVKFFDQYQFKFLTSKVAVNIDEKGAHKIEEDDEKKKIEEDEKGLIVQYHQFVDCAYDSTPVATVVSLMLQALQKIPGSIEARSRQVVPLFLKFLGYTDDNLVSVGSFSLYECKSKDWRSILKEWLNLLKAMRNLRSSYRCEFLKEILQTRLLDDKDAEIQMKVLECLLIWRDDFLFPYDQHLKNLISPKSSREELAKWNLSREANLIEGSHRPKLLPLVIRLLMPKVIKPNALASQKQSGVNYRKTVLRFIAQLDADEVPLFIALLIEPFQATLTRDENILFSSSPDKWRNQHEKRSGGLSKEEKICKKRSGLIHIIEDVLAVFDELRIKPFLDVLMGCVVQVLGSCSTSLESMKCDGSTTAGLAKTISARKLLKDLRSLCLKTTSFVLTKFEDHDLGCGFWDLFITSVKPLINSFKHEASSSEKPSSLFSCFVTMSRSQKLAAILCRQDTLVRDTFSILGNSSAREAIVFCVLKFIENLLVLNTELDDNDSTIKRTFIANLDSLISNLHLRYQNAAQKRRSIKSLGAVELRIFRLLSKHLKDNSLVKKFVEILLSLVTLGAKRSETSVELLQIIQDVVLTLGNEVNGKILNAVCPMIFSAEFDVRQSVCALLDTLGQTDPPLFSVAKFFHELNAASSMEIGELDYDAILSAYEKVDTEFFNTIREEHALVILSQFVYDLSSDELILRQSALGSLVSFVNFCAMRLRQESVGLSQITEGTRTSANEWSRDCILRIMNKFLLKHIGEAMKKGSSVQKEWIELLQEMVIKLPWVTGLESLQALCSKDAEKDFFNNIIHLQKYRRAKALSLFKSVVAEGMLSEAITNKVFLPLFWNMLLDIQDGKGEHVRNVCVEALAAISGQMKWTQYYTLLARCLKEMELKPNKQKLLLRLVCSILDHFHFSTVPCARDAQGLVRDAANPFTFQIDSSSVLRRCGSTVEQLEIQNCLQKTMLPKIQNMLTSDSEKVDVNVSLAALKMLKLLPGEFLDSQLTTIILRISNFLKNRLESTRDAARSALSACLRELGMDYMQFIVSILQATLKRGYELHVLGYTLHYILSHNLGSGCGNLDYCFQDILTVAENDIFGDVADEKDVEKIASKMKETRKNKSFETLKLVSRNVTFKPNALKLLSPVTAHMKKHLTQKTKLKLQTALSHIAAGIDGNPSVDLTDLLIFVYGLIDEGITNEIHKVQDSTSGTIKNYKDVKHTGKTSLSNLISSESQCLHLVTVFALGILQDRIKNMKFNNINNEKLSMLDPFIRLLRNCLDSKYEDILSAAIRCLILLIRYPFPALESEADKIKLIVLDIAQSATNTGSPLFQSSVRLLTVLLRSTKITLSSEQLQHLVQYPLFLDLDKNPSFVALSLLKAIVTRKLVAHEIYDLVTQVAEVMVKSQVETVRKKCSQILLQFLLDYQLSGKRFQQHIDFLLQNLRYKHSTGRESALEMLHTIILKFPKSIVNEQSEIFFMYLVERLADDQDNKIRSMAAMAIKHLIKHITQHSLQSVLTYCLDWYKGPKQQLWSVAAQVLGLLVEVKEKEIHNHIAEVLAITRNILQLTLNVFNDAQHDISECTKIPFWKEAYYSLIMLEKMLYQFSELCFEFEIEDIWQAVVELLLHPHMWLRNISNRLLAFYFRSIAKDISRGHENSNVTPFLMRPSRLFGIAASICCQLMTQLADGAESSSINKREIKEETGNTCPIIENIVFAICSLHGFVVNNECLDGHIFWSTLDPQDQERFLRSFQLLDPRKGSGVFALLTSGVYKSNVEESCTEPGHWLVSYILKRMGKIALEKEAGEMKIVFTTFKRIVQEFGDGVSQDYAIEMLLPLYKVCEGYSGKVIADDLKILALEVRQDIQNRIGTPEYLKLYKQIRNNLKARRDKRKQGEKLMAVTDPVRNAKRKLRVGEKHRAHKKRKMMSLKMGRWMH